MKFELDDIMTTQEAAERWNIAADTIKQICIGRMKKKSFGEGEFRKSGKMWLVTRQGMERLYGPEVNKTE
ncbi:MAG: helix-turn-helix domain-containing protein [Veillonella caviae]|uniref:helix-turn-helix domain-containing protein n=1 Tax=Veillonella caviae TaxID=248316 RepID=UPI002A920555|nr:helix-turn-helix domain-containing protein [Veillonella caviae]MDY5481262.1 helix-turn-helix domain-containing protein [Veillonella caviae]